MEKTAQWAETKSLQQLIIVKILTFLNETGWLFAVLFTIVVFLFYLTQRTRVSVTDQAHTRLVTCQSKLYDFQGRR